MVKVRIFARNLCSPTRLRWSQTRYRHCLDQAPNHADAIWESALQSVGDETVFDCTLQAGREVVGCSWPEPGTCRPLWNRLGLGPDIGAAGPQPRAAPPGPAAPPIAPQLCETLSVAPSGFDLRPIERPGQSEPSTKSSLMRRNT